MADRYGPEDRKRIVAEYKKALGMQGGSAGLVAKKYGVSARTIQVWMRREEGHRRAKNVRLENRFSPAELAKLQAEIRAIKRPGERAEIAARWGVGIGTIYRYAAAESKPPAPQARAAPAKSGRRERRWRHVPREVMAAVLRDLDAGMTVEAAAKVHDISRTVITKMRARMRNQGASATDEAVNVALDIANGEILPETAAVSIARVPIATMTAEELRGDGPDLQPLKSALRRLKDQGYVVVLTIASGGEYECEVRTDKRRIDL